MGIFNKWRSKSAVQPVESPEANSPIRSENDTITLGGIEELAEALGIVGSLAGPVVNSRTAMKQTIVYSCTRLIAGAMAGMPIHIYRDSPSGGRERDSSNPLVSLLNLQPTPLMSAAMFWEYVTASMLMEGDGFAVILRDRMGDPIELLPLNPLHVHVEIRGNRLAYFVMLDGVPRGFDQDDVLHFPGFGFNGTRSLSVIKYAAVNSIGMAIAMEQFGADFFKSGATPSFAVIKEGKWETADQENFRNAWVKTYGGIDKRKYPLTIGKGLDIKPLQVNAAESQLLESREFENINIATAFGVPAFLVNQGKNVTAWGSGMAEQGIGLVRFTLSPHMLRFQQELNRKLFMHSRSFCEFNPAGLLRGTQKERNEAYKSALGGSNVPGYMCINEVRRLENLEPIDNPIYDQPYDPRMVGATPFKEEKKNG